MAAVSPAVVVPCLLNLKDRGYGIEKGIPTIVIAAASLDDILAISCFGFTLTFALSRQEHWTQSLIQGPLEIIFGLLFGIVWGLLMGIILNVTNEKVFPI
jgi:NhaP-type Na+/H+ or K+/H+ antiporter